ncbi:MAG: hypothetical protein OXH60_12185 [Rhodospirillales bacterium]|nr:hypothetical protein [Rhodospirillales bacterium]
MAFLMDTNVISETVRPRPDKTVLHWIEAQTPSDLFLAVQTIGELVRGVRKVAAVWGRLLGDGDRTGHRPSAADAQIAAAAIQHDLTLVTHNVKDFRSFDIQLLDPWQHPEGGQ